MKRFLGVFLIILVGGQTWSQGLYCGNNNRKSLVEIKEQFPYNKTYSIKVVSFKGYDSIPKTAGQVDFQKMYEVKTLDESLTDKMFDILANYQNESGIMKVAFCWEPRNGVVLLDNNNSVVTYLDICFACQRYFAPEPGLFGIFCNEKLDAIKEIMKEAGITYGMRRNEPIEPSNNKGHSHNKEGVFMVVDEPPEFPGGSEAMRKFIFDHLKYPTSARKRKVEGTVYVSFIIETDGSIAQVSIVKGMHQDCDREALRVIKSMPRWNAGKDQGEYVRVKYVTPVEYSLSNSKD